MENILTVTPKRQNENNSQYAYRNLYYNIMRLALKPGQRLNEAELTSELGISSTPFRQALSRLREEGLVDVRSQSSTTVSYIDYGLLQENIFIRCTLEAAVIEQLCAQGLSPEYRERLRENLNIQELFVRDPMKRERFFELDNEFHRLLFAAAGKPWTYAAMCRSCAQLDRLRYINSFSEQTELHAGSPFFYDGHRAVYDAIIRGDRSPMGERVMRHLCGGQGEIRFPPHIQKYVVNFPESARL